MFADLINQLAKTYQEERKGDYYARPSSAGPEKCIRALAYNANGMKGSQLPGRAILTFDDSSWHEELTLDWMNKMAFSNHSEQMPVDLPAPGVNKSGHFCRSCKKDIPPETIHGHIDWIATDPLMNDWLVEHKALSMFGSQRCEKEFPMDYLTQASIYSASLQRIQPDLHRVILIIKNKNTAQYIEFECDYDASLDCLTIHRRIISRGDAPADVHKIEEKIENIVGDALLKFKAIDELALNHKIPPRQYDRDRDWHCGYCLPPKTKILMDDFSWKVMEKISPGESIITFTEEREGKHRRVVRAKVQGIKYRKSETITIETHKGKIRCSPDHPWLVQDIKKKAVWKKAKNISPRDKMFFLVSPDRNAAFSDGYKIGYIHGIVECEAHIRKSHNWPSIRVAVKDSVALDRYKDYLNYFKIKRSRGAFVHQSPTVMEKVLVSSTGINDLLDILEEPLSGYDQAAGYMAGIFDGEGSLGQNNLRIYNSDEKILDKIQWAASELDLNFQIEPFSKQAVNVIVKSARLYSRRGMVSMFEFFNRTRPAITRKIDNLYGMAFFDGWVEITSISHGGPEVLIDMQTSSKTFIADGFASHNCPYLEPCYENYEKEFNALAKDVEINQDMETEFKYYLQLAGEARTSQKAYEDLRDKIKDRLKGADIRAGKTKEYTAKITLSPRETVVKALIPPDLLPKVTKISTSEKLTIRKIKKDG